MDKVNKDKWTRVTMLVHNETMDGLREFHPFRGGKISALIRDVLERWVLDEERRRSKSNQSS